MGFDVAEYIKNANEKEHAAPGATPAASPASKSAAPAAATATGGEGATGDHENNEPGRMSRSQRRQLRRMGELEGENKELRARLTALETKPEGAKQGEKPAAAAAAPGAGLADDDPNDPKPDSSKYTDFNKLNEDLARWAARQETKKANAEKDQLEGYRQHLQAMDAKASEDVKSIPEWEEHRKMAMEDGPEFDPAEHPQLMALIAGSDQKAFVLDYFAVHPEEAERFLELTKNPQKQIQQFHRLEGKVEKLYEKKPDAAGEKKEEKAGEKKTPTAAERDAKKARPSEALAATGGSAPNTDLSPYLADGKTINPAWRDRMNEREGRRR